MHAPASPAAIADVPAFKEFSRPDHPIDDIVPSPYQTREHFDEVKLEGLAQSIRAQGVISPITLRIIAGNKYELVDGERRWRAAKLAGLQVVPVTVKPLTDIQAAEAVIVTNEQREPVTPLERARGFARLMDIDPRYRDRQVIADKTGMSLSWVHNAMKLLEASEPVQKALLKGSIGEWHAIAIARLQPADQMRALKECTLREYHNVPGGSTISVKALKEWIARNVHMDLDKAPFPAEDVDLVPAAGACSGCPKRAGAQPELHETKHANTCTDRSCYTAKTRAQTARRLRALSVDGATPVQVIEPYYLETDDRKRLGGTILAREAYKSAGNKNCPHTHPAVLLDVESGGVKSELRVCIKPHECSVHSDRQSRASRTPSASDKAEATRRKKQEQARRVEADVRRSILFAIRDKVQELALEDLRLVARRFLYEMHADRQKSVYGYMGWETPAKTKAQYRSPYVDYRKATEQQLATADTVGVSRFLIVAALSQDAAVGSYNWQSDKVEHLHGTAKRWKVDAARLERDVRAAASAAGRSKASKKRVETSPRKSTAKKKR